MVALRYHFNHLIKNLNLIIISIKRKYCRSSSTGGAADCGSEGSEFESHLLHQLEEIVKHGTNYEKRQKA